MSSILSKGFTRKGLMLFSGYSLETFKVSYLTKKKGLLSGSATVSQLIKNSKCMKDSFGRN